jgi:hypothetical protein
MGKRGPKFWNGPTPQQMDQIRDLMLSAAQTGIAPQEVISYVGLAKLLGKDRQTISEYLKREPGSEMALTIATGADLGIARVATAIFQKATGLKDSKTGKLLAADADIPAARLFMEMNGRIKSKVEITGKDGAPISADIDISVNDLLRGAKPAGRRRAPEK